MFSMHDLPESSHPYKGSKILILVAQLGKDRPREGRFLAQGHTGDSDRVSRPSRVSVADPPAPLTRLAPPIAALRGGAHPPAVRPSAVCLGVYAVAAVHSSPAPSPAQGEAGVSSAGPAPHTAADRRQRLRPRTPQRVSRSRRGKGTAHLLLPRCFLS